MTSLSSKQLFGKVGLKKLNKRSIMDKAMQIKNISENSDNIKEPSEYTESVAMSPIVKEPIEHTEITNYIVVNPPHPVAPPSSINNNINNNGGIKFQLNWVFPLVSAIILGGFAAMRDFKDKKKIIKYTLFGGFLGSILGLRIEHEKKYISVFKYITLIAFPPEKENTTKRLGYNNNNTLSLPANNSVDTIADHIVMDNSPEVNAQELTKLIESQSLESLGVIITGDTSGDSDSINNNNYTALAEQPISYIQGGEIIPPFEKEPIPLPIEEESIKEGPVEEKLDETENVLSGPITLIENDDFIDELITNHSNGDTSLNEASGSTVESTKNPPKFFMRPGGIQRKKVRAGNNKKKKNKRKK